MSSGNSQRPPRVASVSATVQILRLLSSEIHPLGVNGIAKRLDLTPSACFNILKTLVNEHFVEFDEGSKTYSLGKGIVAIARRALDPWAAFEAIRGGAERLADERGLTVGLWRMVRDERLVLVGYAVGETGLRIHMTVGQRLPLLMGAAGRCIAASEAFSDAEFRRHFAQLRWQNPVTLERYCEEVEEARRVGWSIDTGNFIRGVTTLATPIRDPAGKVRFCLTATMFTGQYDTEAMPMIADEMLAISASASQRLHSPVSGFIANIRIAADPGSQVSPDL